ncbi:MAG: ACP phosphodiesterase [Anaerolineales bacterium]
MNFLAHAYLAPPSVPLTLGNFIGDFVKGRRINLYSPEITEGIVMHRKIDTFTDSHPVFKQSCCRIRRKYNHYSGVIIDLFYDHFLARNWIDYSQIPLNHFTKGVYDIIQDHEHLIPDRARYILPYMVKSDWLLNYATIEGIDRSLKGLSRRTSFQSGMEHASQELIKHYDNLHDDFRIFFPDIINFISQ